MYGYSTSTSILYYGIGFLSFFLTVGIAIYLFIDALRCKRNFILWPLATVVLAIAFGVVPNIFGFSYFRWGSILSFIVPIGAIFLYIATKDETSLQSNEEDTMAQGMKRAYFYIFSFITLGILFFGVADLIRVLLEYGSRNSGVSQDMYRYSYGYTQESFTRNVSFRLATIIVTLPIWLFHWFHLLGNIKKLQDPRELRLTFKTHKSYLYLILGLTLITIIIFGIWFVYQILNFILGASSLQLRDFAAPLGYTLTSLAVFSYHFWILRSREFDMLEEKVAALQPTTAHPAPQAVAPAAQAPAAGQFCPKCGTQNAKDSAFCTSCGNRLH